MAKMHSRKGSSLVPTAHGTKAPEWSDISKEELEKTIIKLHDTGMSSASLASRLETNMECQTASWYWE